MISALFARRSRSGRELARWRSTAVGPGAQPRRFRRAPRSGAVSTLRFQLPPSEPCMRFSRTRLTGSLEEGHDQKLDRQTLT